MRLAVIGSKEFHNYSKLKSVLAMISGITAIISGAATGTDSLAACYAVEHNLKLIEFPPEFEKFGDKAKHIRNRQIVENCDQLIAFWHGKCEGTKYTLDYAAKMNLPIRIIEI